MSFNKTITVGYVGKDAEMRYTPNGKPVTSFSLATNRSWVNAAGEKQEKTTWFRVTCWGKLAETAAKWIIKGKLLLVEGQIDVSAYLGQDGTPRASLELTAENFKFLGKREDNGDEHAGFEPGVSADEEMPF